MMGLMRLSTIKRVLARENVNLDKDLQLSLYALACRDVFRIPVSKLSLYYIEDVVKASTERSEAVLRRC